MRCACACACAVPMCINYIKKRREIRGEAKLNFDFDNTTKKTQIHIQDCISYLRDTWKTNLIDKILGNCK